MKSFLSTSLKRNVAGLYIAWQPEADSHFVLFEVDANSFAQLSASSAIPNEEEILFMMNSIFRITDIREGDSKSIICLELCSNNDNTFKTVFECLKKDYGGETAGYETEANLNSFATVLFNIGKYDVADKFFRRLYNELPQSHRDRARCSHNIGNVTLQKGKYQESLRWLSKALDLYQHTWPSDHPVVANTYHCIGNLHQRKKKYWQAINAYQMAMDKFRLYYGNNHPRVALCYASLASVYFLQKNFEHAISLYREALIIDAKCLPPFHPDLVFIHHKLACALNENEQQDLALEHYEKALTIAIKTLPSNDVLLLGIYAQTGEIYRKIGNVQQAIDYFQEAAIIANHTSLRSRRRLNNKIYYACSQCEQLVWAYVTFDRIKETYPVCFIFHSKLASWFSKRFQ